MQMRGFKYYFKHVTRVEAEPKTGYDWHGTFLAPGENKLPVGALILHIDDTDAHRLLQVIHDGSLVVLATTTERWVTELASAAHTLLATDS